MSPVPGPGPGSGSLPRLLKGLDPGGRALSLAEHIAVHGPLPAGRPGNAPDQALIAEIERSGIRGRGGASFPTGRKMASVAAGRGQRVVLVNGSEGEPVSSKDRLLMTRAPHLVLDGAAVAARAVGASLVIVATKRPAVRPLERAVAERAAAGLDEVGAERSVGPERYLAGEESALVNFLTTGRSVPTQVPPRPYERGVGGRPTLVQNADTVANLALIARHGAAWFRQAGTAGDPGTALITLGGAVERPGVYEVARGTPVAALVGLAGGPSTAVQAVLIGGYAGAWLPAAEAWDAPLDEVALTARHGVLAVGAVTVLPEGVCPVAETSRILRYLADEGAGQCGPCVHGLAAIARAGDGLARGSERRDVVERLERWAGQVEGRGACHHPDGAVRLLRSALRTFRDDVAAHRAGRPCAGAPPAGRARTMVRW